MFKQLISIVAIGALPFLIASEVDAQTQVRNFNLNCGLIGKFVRYPPHLQHCRALVVCDEHRLCRKKKSILQEPLVEELGLSVLPLDDDVSDTTSSDETDSGESASNDVNAVIGARASADAGLGGGGVGAHIGGGASAGSGSPGSASAGASSGVPAGGLGAGAGGSLGVGGL